MQFFVSLGGWKIVTKRNLKKNEGLAKVLIEEL